MIKNKRIIIQTYGKILYNTALSVANKTISDFIEKGYKDIIYTYKDYCEKLIICYIKDNEKSIKLEIYYQEETK